MAEDRSLSLNTNHTSVDIVEWEYVGVMIRRVILDNGEEALYRVHHCEACHRPTFASLTRMDNTLIEQTEQIPCLCDEFNDKMERSGS